MQCATVFETRLYHAETQACVSAVHHTARALVIIAPSAARLATTESTVRARSQENEFVLGTLRTGWWTGFGSSGMWCLRMLRLKITAYRPSKTEGVVGTPHLNWIRVRGFQLVISSKPHILKHHIPEYPLDIDWACLGWTGQDWAGLEWHWQGWGGVSCDGMR